MYPHVSHVSLQKLCMHLQGGVCVCDLHRMFEWHTYSLNDPFRELHVQYAIIYVKNVSFRLFLIPKHPVRLLKITWYYSIQCHKTNHIISTLAGPDTKSYAVELLNGFLVISVDHYRFQMCLHGINPNKTAQWCCPDREIQVASGSPWSLVTGLGFPNALAIWKSYWTSLQDRKAMAEWSTPLASASLAAKCNFRKWENNKNRKREVLFRKSNWKLVYLFIYFLKTRASYVWPWPKVIR